MSSEDGHGTSTHKHVHGGEEEGATPSKRKKLCSLGTGEMVHGKICVVNKSQTCMKNILVNLCPDFRDKSSLLTLPCALLASHSWLGVFGFALASHGGGCIHSLAFQVCEVACLVQDKWESCLTRTLHHFLFLSFLFSLYLCLCRI